MSLQEHGINIFSENEVTGVSRLGFWIIVSDAEYFVPFSDYPQFKSATVEQLLSFKTLSPTQIYWESLDLDIELEALRDPQHFPLEYR